MNELGTVRTINIRPNVGVYATYRRLSYRPWYALAEFVDNSTQNYYDHKKELLAAYRREGAEGRLRMEIAYDAEERKLIVADDANGMNFDELTRAVVLDRPPPDTSGRCEYGMGLKTAACWFGASWRIETCHLGDGRKLTVTVNVEDLAKRRTDTLHVQEARTGREKHFTMITVFDLYKRMQTRTLGKVKEQLGSMYRDDLRDGDVEILFNGVPISYEEPTFLKEELDGGIVNEWKKEVSFSVPGEKDGELKVRGWIGIMNPGSWNKAGFALLRRGRVVVGGPGEGYKPPEIFGPSNSFRSLRLAGELHMDEWPVTQAKDSFDWAGGLEESFLEELKRQCLDYTDKAESYRENKDKISKKDVELASEKSRDIFTHPDLGRALNDEIRFPEVRKTNEQQQSDMVKLKEASFGPFLFRLDVGGNVWEFRLHWQNKLSDAYWMEVSYPQDNQIDVFLNLAHPFLLSYLKDKQLLELVHRFVLSLALAEKWARQTSRNGLVEPGDIRTYMNKVLRRASEIEEKHLG